MKTFVQDFERAVLFEQGKPAQLLGPGTHKYNEKRSQLTQVDMRSRVLRVSGQEILTADGVAVKCGAVVVYTVADPLVWVMAAGGYSNAEELMYLDVQLALRDMISGTAATDLLSSRNAWAHEFEPVSAENQQKYGVLVSNASIRDLSFPGDLKAKFAQVAVAKQEAAASLERARGEQATLRSLANAARLIEGNPELKSLRALVALEKTGGQIVFKND